MSKMTLVQQNALVAINSKYDEMDASERKNWGKAFTGWLDVTGDFDVRTVHKLHDLGLIEFQGVTNVHSIMRRGSFGRWLGGTRNVLSTQILVKPTVEGRQRQAALS